MAVYNIFDSTNMRSTHYGERIFDAVATEDIENGTFGYLDGLATGEKHIYNFKKGTKEGELIVVADNPAWNEDTSRLGNQARDKYIIPAGTAFRVRVVKVTDEFATAIEGVTAASQSAMAVGAFVTIDATTGKLVAAAQKPNGGALVGEVMRTRDLGSVVVTTARTYGRAKTMYTVKVLSLAVQS